MKWIVSARPEIVQNLSELYARSEFIQLVSNAGVTNWDIIRDSRGTNRFYVCFTDDGINGIFVTGHIGEVMELCRAAQVDTCDFVIANTCIWNQLNDKSILYELLKKHSEMKLWFAKQELSCETNYWLRKTNTLSDVGTFGFPTSKSERILFENRRKGFMVAIEKAFDKVSPILLPADYNT